MGGAEVGGDGGVGGGTVLQLWPVGLVQGVWQRGGFLRPEGWLWPGEMGRCGSGDTQDNLGESPRQLPCYHMCRAHGRPSGGALGGTAPLAAWASLPVPPCPGLWVVFKLHAMVRQWGPLALGTWELRVPRASPAKAAAVAPPGDGRALGSGFPSTVRLLVAEPGRDTHLGGQRSLRFSE